MVFSKSSLFVLVLLYCNFAIAQSGGDNTYDFLDLPISARSTGLGGSALTINDGDLNVALENPALLSDTMDNKVSLNYINYFADVNYGYVAYSKNLKKNNNLAFGIQYLDYGKFTRTDVIGNENGSFSANDLSINISYARVIKDSTFVVGTSLKTIYSHIDNYQSWGSAIDLAGLYTSKNKSLNAALLIKNAGFQWSSYVKGEREKLPFETQVGISKRLKHAPFRFLLTYNHIVKWDLTNGIETPLEEDASKWKRNTYKTGLFVDKLMRHLVIGSEFIITKNLFLRAGFNYQRRKELKIEAKRGLVGFTFGFGFKIKQFELSYGRASYHIAGASNNFSIAFDINNFYKKAK